MKKEPANSTDCMLTKNEHTAMEASTTKSEHEQLFNCLYTGLYKKVYGCALYYCRSTDTAKDLTHDVFMRVWSQMDRLTAALGNRSSLGTWENYLFIMTKNITLNYRKKSS